MTTTPAPVQPVEVEPIVPITPDPFVLAFLAYGTQAEYHRSNLLVFPTVNGREYQYCLVNCECADLTLHYIPDPALHIGYFYSLCAAHGLQPLGRAARVQREGRSEMAERRRKSGTSTSRWYHQRGM